MRLLGWQLGWARPGVGVAGESQPQLGWWLVLKLQLKLELGPQLGLVMVQQQWKHTVLHWKAAQ